MKENISIKEENTENNNLGQTEKKKIEINKRSEFSLKGGKSHFQCIQEE